MAGFQGRFEAATHVDSTYFSVIDRFETTGKVKAELLEPLHITGPVARSPAKQLILESTTHMGYTKN